MAGPQFRDLHLDVAAAGCDSFRPVSVAVVRAVGGAFVSTGAEDLDGFGIDQRLQAGADKFGEHRDGIIQLGDQGRMIVDHRVDPLVESLVR